VDFKVFKNLLEFWVVVGFMSETMESRIKNLAILLYPLV